MAEAKRYSATGGSFVVAGFLALTFVGRLRTSCVVPSPRYVNLLDIEIYHSNLQCKRGWLAKRPIHHVTFLWILAFRVRRLKVFFYDF